MTTETKKPLPALMARQITNLSTGGNFKTARIPNEHTLEEVCAPAYWAHVAADHIIPRWINIIFCEWEDKSKFAMLWVSSSDNAGAVVHVVQSVGFDQKVEKPKTETKESSGKNPKDKSEHEGYSLMWVDPQTKFRVIRLSDNSIVEDGIASAEAGNAFIAQHKAKNK